MRRLAAIAIVIGAALAALLAATFVDRSHGASPALAGPLTVNWALSSTTLAFGDTVAAEVDVVSRDRDVPARSVRVVTAFEPFTVVARKIDRDHVRGASLLRTRVTLQCLTRACLPPAGGHLVQLRPAVVSYEKAGRPAQATIRWNPLHVSSRLPIAGSSAGLADTAPPLDPAFARSPPLVRFVLLAATVLLALVGAALVASALWPSSLRARRQWEKLSPLERSVLSVEAAARNESEPERRRTLDQLALRLGEAQASELELQTRALAWGEQPPDGDDLTLLAAEVRSSLNGRVRG